MSIASLDWAGLSRMLDIALSLPTDRRSAWIESLDHAGGLKILLRDLLANEDQLRESGFLEVLPDVGWGRPGLRAELAALLVELARRRE